MLLGHFLLMLFFLNTDKVQKKRLNGEGKSLKTMAVSEVVTFGIQKQQLSDRSKPEESTMLPESDIPLQTDGEGDIVILSLANEQPLSQYSGEIQHTDSQTVQEISSVAQAASTFSQAVEGKLNEDELVAIQKLAAKIEPIAKEFLSSDFKELNIAEAIDMPQPKIVSVEADTPEFDVENIRQLPVLVSATIDAGFEKQFQALNESNRELIVSSLSELMQFFREKVVRVLEPLRHPSPLPQGEDQVPVEAELV